MVEKEYKFKEIIKLSNQFNNYPYLVKSSMSSGLVYNRKCGDTIDFSFNINNGIVEKVGISGECCSISKAAAVKLSSELTGKKLDDITEEYLLSIIATLGFDLKNLRIDCALLPLNAVAKALGVECSSAL